jgi:superfamily II DNA/RNA helicase
MSLSFADLGVSDAHVRRLEARGIYEPFPIQSAALPDALAGRDVVGKAPTGSGKTLAFGLALVARTPKAAPRRPRGLVLVPTRELAAQVQKELAQLTPDKGRRVLCIYGGTSYNVARKALAAGVDIVVACPGRLEDMLEQRGLDLAEVTTVVVDEADRMADMGFLPAVRRIIGQTAEDRHVMLFSATMGPDVQSLVREFTRDAAVHDVVGEESPSDVDHFFWKVPREQRSAVTAEIADKYDRAIVFTRTKHGADRLARQLEERGVSAVPIHGDRTQAQRERALRSVKNGSIRVLVATDVAARGIHIEALPCVIHFDPPVQATDYLHRSGRTGRAGANGVVISLVGEDVVAQVRRLQKALGVASVIDPPERAEPVRLSAVDDATATQRLDDRSAAKSAPRPAARERRSGPVGARPARPARAPFGGDRNDRTASEHPRRERATRPASSPRVDRARPARAPGEHRDSRPAPGRDRERPAERTASRGGEAVVSFFNESKGYGFATDAAGQDHFIHFSSIVGDGFKTLEAGQRVAFEPAQGPKGLEARNVRVVSGGRRRP